MNWEVQARNYSGFDVITKVPHKPSGKLTFRVVARLPDGTGAQKEANAGVIAAAPELLASLTAIMKYTGEWPRKFNRPYCGGSFLSEKLFDQAEQAIEKATCNVRGNPKCSITGGSENKTEADVASSLLAQGGGK